MGRCVASAMRCVANALLRECAASAMRSVASLCDANALLRECAPCEMRCVGNALRRECVPHCRFWLHGQLGVRIPFIWNVLRRMFVMRYAVYGMRWFLWPVASQH